MSISPSPSPSPSPSSSPLTATIATSSPITALPAANSHHHLLLLQNPSDSSNLNLNPTPGVRRFPPPCWTNDETLALIHSYRDKWFSLRRTNLRAAHWDDVAQAVADRSLHLPSSTPKSSVQCRHKIEKLRKRYRAERKRSLAHDPSAPPSSPWIFFSHMEQLETHHNPNPNPNPIVNAIPLAIPRYPDHDLDDDIDQARFYKRTQGVAAANGGLKFKIPKVVGSTAGKIMEAIPIGESEFDKEMRRRMEAKRRREEEEEEEEEIIDKNPMGEMVRALRALGDGYMKMEQIKMEAAREMERARMEMELKRTEMILDSHMRTVDSFVKGFIGDKKSVYDQYWAKGQLIANCSDPFAQLSFPAPPFWLPSQYPTQPLLDRPAFYGEPIVEAPLFTSGTLTRNLGHETFEFELRGDQSYEELYRQCREL